MKYFLKYLLVSFVAIWFFEINSEHQIASKITELNNWIFYPSWVFIFQNPL